MSNSNKSFSDKLKHWLKEFWLFITSLIFVKSFAKMVAFLLGVFLLLNLGMRCYTRHGKSVVVDNYVEMNVDKAIEKLEDKSFRYVLSDSVFIVDKAPGIVLDQNPKPDAKVKKGRTIYMTITKKTPDEVKLPGLVGNYDYKQYLRKLKLLNLRATIKEKQFNNKLEENTILHFYYGDRKITDRELRDGVKIPMGSTLDFVISTRTGGFVEVPDLVCRQLNDAKFLISGSGLKVGDINPGNASDTDPNAFVRLQVPSFAPGKKIKLGDEIDLVLSKEKPANCN